MFTLQIVLTPEAVKTVHLLCRLIRAHIDIFSKVVILLEETIFPDRMTTVAAMVEKIEGGRKNKKGKQVIGVTNGLS
jgi:hypothetical protein